MSNSELIQVGGRSVFAVASAIGIVAALRVGAALRDAVMVLSPMDEAAY